MKKILTIICSALLATVAQAAQTTLGNLPKLTTVPQPNTNYIPMVIGAASNSPNRTISFDDMIVAISTNANLPLVTRTQLLTASNALVTLAHTFDLTTSNGCVQFTMAASNTLYALIGAGSGATNILSGRVITVDNASLTANDANSGTNLALPKLTVTNTMESLRNNDTVYIRPGTYTALGRGEAYYVNWSDRTNAPIRLNSLTNVTIEGTGPGSLIQYTGVGNIISLYNCSGITFRNLRFKGPGPNQNQSANTWTNIFGVITMWNAKTLQVAGGAGTNVNIRVEGCIFEDYPDHAVIGIPGSENYGVTIVNNEFRSGGEAYHPTMDRDGAAVVPGASQVVVAGNRFDDIQHAIEFEQSFAGGGSPGVMADITIVGNQIKNAWHHGITIWPAVTSQAKNVVISGNTIECIPTNHPAIVAASVGIEVAGGSEFAIANNTLRGGWNYGIAVSATLNASNGVISGNSIAVDGLGAGNLAIGISVQHTATGYADSWLIDGNTIAGAEDFAAIYVSGKNTVVRNNLITYTLTAGHGVMVVTNVPANSTTNNVVAGNSFFGIGGTNIVIGPGVTNAILANNTTTTPKARWLADSGTGTRYSFIFSEPIVAGSNITFSTNATTGEITINGSAGAQATNLLTSNFEVYEKSGWFVISNANLGTAQVRYEATTGDSIIGGDDVQIIATTLRINPPTWHSNTVTGLEFDGTIFKPNVHYLPDVGSSTPTLFGTNQVYHWNILSNSTFDVSGLINSNVYRVRFTNNTSTITWPGTLRWWDGTTMADAPALQAQSGEFIIWKDESGTNASVTIAKSFGISAQAFASVLEWDMNKGRDFTVTNRVTGVATVVVTNAVDGQEFSGFIAGEASGGTSRVITIVPTLGHLILNGDDYAGTPALSFTTTLTNGNWLEVSGKHRKLWPNNANAPTNVLSLITRQGKL